MESFFPANREASCTLIGPENPSTDPLIYRGFWDIETFVFQSRRCHVDTDEVLVDAAGNRFRVLLSVGTKINKCFNSAIDVQCPILHHGAMSDSSAEILD